MGEKKRTFRLRGTSQVLLQNPFFLDHPDSGRRLSDAESGHCAFVHLYPEDRCLSPGDSTLRTASTLRKILWEGIYADHNRSNRGPRHDCRVTPWFFLPLWRLGSELTAKYVYVQNFHSGILLEIFAIVIQSTPPGSEHTQASLHQRTKARYPHFVIWD
jgi:hypothetical protein